MTAVGLAFIGVGLLLAIALAWRMRTWVYVGLFFVHLGAAFFYWQYSLQRMADSWHYYNFSDSAASFAVGTWFVGWFTASWRDLLDASYVDMFMVFQLSGYLGIAALYHLGNEIACSDSPSPRGPKLFAATAAFLPGLQVWTSGIGKDALMFLGVMAVVWGTYKPATRLWGLVCGLLLCILVRPHMAAFLVVAIALPLAFTRDLPLIWRAAIFTSLAVGFVAALPFVLDYVGLQATGSDSVISYIEQRQTSNMEGGSSVDISSYSFPLQFLTYMFRPLFFDATNTLSLIVSLENSIYVFSALLWGGFVFQELRQGKHSFFLRVNFIFWALSTSVLAATTANLGIAVRQKNQIIPSFLVLLLTAYCGRLRAKNINASETTTSTSSAHEIDGSTPSTAPLASGTP